MQQSNTAPENTTQGNRETSVVEVRRSDLPVHCPSGEGQLWSSHPRVFIPVEAKGEASCSYCGTVYKLVDQ